MKILYQFLIGVSLGWLVGLSVSPTVQIVLTAVVGLVVTITSILCGINETSQSINKSSIAQFFDTIKRIDLLIVLVLLLGLDLGSSLGVYVRTHELLGSNIAEEIDSWYDTGLPRHQIATRIFYHRFPTGPQGHLKESDGVLFKNESSMCESVSGYSGKTLVISLASLNDPLGNLILSLSDNPDTVKILINSICDHE